MKAQKRSSRKRRMMKLGMRHVARRPGNCLDHLVSLDSGEEEEEEEEEEEVTDRSKEEKDKRRRNVSILVRGCPSL